MKKLARHVRYNEIVDEMQKGIPISKMFEIFHASNRIIAGSDAVRRKIWRVYNVKWALTGVMPDDPDFKKVSVDDQTFREIAELLQSKALGATCHDSV